MTPRPLRRWVVAAGAALAVAAAAVATPEGRAPTARQRFDAARAADADARAAAGVVVEGATDAAIERAVKQVRRVAAQYEALVRRFPTSGYSDDALYHAATLMQWVHGRFGRDADRTSAAKYLAWMLREYPRSKHVRDARLAARTLERPAPRVDASVARASQTPGAAKSRPPSAPAEAPLAEVAPAVVVPVMARAVAEPPAGPPTLRAISRTVLDDTVRVTLALDREAPFTHEILSGPPRAFVDLFGAATTDALEDASVKFDVDAVRQVRVGRRPGAVRVVLDLTETTRVSVYTLYHPFRVVIDADRVSTTRAQAPAPAVALPPPSTATSRPALVARTSPPPRPVAVPEPLSPPVALPAEAPVVLTGETTAAANTAVAAAVETLWPEPAAAAPPVPVGGPEVAALEPAAAAAVAVAPRGAGTAARPTPSTPGAAVSETAGFGPLAPSANTDGSFSLARQLGLGVSRIVIDPGHGGHDPGTIAHGSSEAKLVLDVALRLEKLLERDGFDVVLTRRTDVFIPLEERTAIANRERADLFLSIHANASRNPKARGIETYYLSFASNPDAETVAARENATSAGGMHNLPSIVRAIALNNKLDESRDLAGMVQRALAVQFAKGAEGSSNRGVKKAPFVVLIGAAMPSVLAEIGFITNKTEAGFIKTPAHRQRIAQALHDAVVQYQRSLKRATTVAATGR